MELWDQANQLHLDGKYEEAKKLYDVLLTQNPDNPGLLATYGTLCLHTKEHGLATSMLYYAMKQLERKNAQVPSDILSNLGLAYKYSGQPEIAIKYMTRAISNKPSPESYNVLASMYVEEGAPEKAIKYTTIALEKDPNLPSAHWNRSVANLEIGEWAKGWDEHDWGFQAKTRADRKLGGRPRWDGKSPGTVCIYGEQGIGDEIMFASILPDVLKTNPIVIESHQRLVKLFEKSFPGIPVHGTREDPMVDWQEDFDYQISMGSLGQYYRRSKSDCSGLPYLTCDDPLPRGDKFRVGISWTGGHKLGRVLKRTVPLMWWKKILENDCEFVSLQYTDCDAEIQEVENALGIKITRHEDLIKAHDYYQTARVVMSCDLVISVCTSVIHLAGALGVPCWVMTPAHPAWRYQNSGPMPWYKSVRLYRQPAGDKAAWIPVIDKIAGDLTSLAEPELKVAYG